MPRIGIEGAPPVLPIDIVSHRALRAPRDYFLAWFFEGEKPGQELSPAKRDNIDEQCRH